MSDLRAYKIRPPQHGDLLLLCEHDVEPLYCGNIANLDIRVRFRCGTVRQAMWACVCADCFNAASRDFEAIEYQQTGTWVGNTPLLELPLDS